MKHKKNLNLNLFLMLPSGLHSEKTHNIILNLVRSVRTAATAAVAIEGDTEWIDVCVFMIEGMGCLHTA